MRTPIKSIKNKLTPETISIIKKRIANLSPKSKGLALKAVNSEIKEWATKQGYTITENDDGTGLLKF